MKKFTLSVVLFVLCCYVLPLAAQDFSFLEYDNTGLADNDIPQWNSSGSKWTVESLDDVLTPSFTPFDISGSISFGASSGTWSPSIDFAYALVVGKLLWINFRTGSATPSANCSWLTLTLPYTLKNTPSGGQHGGSAFVVLGATVENDGELFGQDNSTVVRIYRSARALYSSSSATTVQGNAWFYLD